MNTYEKANCATETMTASYYKAMGSIGKPEYSYIDPNQFDEADWEAVMVTYPKFEDVDQYPDTLEQAKLIADLIGAPVEVTVWDGNPKDYCTQEISRETIYPNRKS